MAKVIPNETLKNLKGKPVRMPKRDEDGNVIWKDKDAQVPEMTEAKALDALWLLTNIPRTIHAEKDRLRIPALANQLIHAEDAEVAEDAKVIELTEKTYDWVHRVLNRELPLTAQEKEQGMKPLIFAESLFGTALAALVIEHLKPLDVRKAFTGDEED